MIGSQQSHTTEEINKAISAFLDYVATYPKDGIIYRASDMILAAHSNAGFHNESKGHSTAGAHICLLENNPIPRWNGTVLTIAQIIKFVMSSATEAELGALYITARKLLPCV